MKKLSLACALFALILSLTSCGDDSKTGDTQKTSEKSSVAVIVNIASIQSKTPAEVEATFGKPQSTEKVNGYPCEGFACQKSTYQDGKYEIIFKEGKADRITINNTPDLTGNDNALEALSLSPSKAAFSNPGNVARWTGVNNIHEISFFPNYILVQITE